MLENIEGQKVATITWPARQGGEWVICLLNPAVLSAPKQK